MGQLQFSKGAFLAIVTAGLLGWTSSAKAVTVYGLTNTNGLISFDSSTPQNVISATDHIGGLIANDDLIGIDFSPINGSLYAVGTGGGTAGSAHVYTIDPLTGTATMVSTMSTSLNGSRFGFDFNPTSGGLRITSNTNQNLRVTVATGATTTDVPLAYQPGDLFFGQKPNIIASAYTNNFSGASSTQLFGIDSVRNSLVLQNPNAGTLQTIGLLGVDISQVGEFDIYFDPITLLNKGFAALQNVAEGVSRFYTIDLATGQATPVGLDFGDLIDGVAVAPAAVPEPSTLALLGLGIVAAGARLFRRRA